MLSNILHLSLVDGVSPHAMTVYSLFRSRRFRVSQDEDLSNSWLPVQELRHELLDSEGWHILVAHYLGVDHAGHTFGVHSSEMFAKVKQMDTEIVQVRGCEVSAI
jgi:predicted AlkP superfamily pyrophosphatase or phosphodiesterase